MQLRDSGLVLLDEGFELSPCRVIQREKAPKICCVCIELILSAAAVDSKRSSVHHILHPLDLLLPRVALGENLLLSERLGSRHHSSCGVYTHASALHPALKYRHTMQVDTNNELPAVAPPLTPEMAVDFTDKAQNALTVSFSLTNHPWTFNPAVATEDAVIYATNPYWQVCC